MTDQWISVKEKLPGKFTNVLVFGDRGTYAIACVDSSGKFDCYPLLEGEKVTHWQPLPNPPKQ